MTSVIVADDHEVARRGLRALLSEAAELEVVGEASDGAEAVALARRLRPDVAVLDITMPRMSGLEACRLIRAECPHTEVLILTVHDAELVVQEVLAAGALGYVLKSETGRNIFDAVGALATHQPYYSARMFFATSPPPGSLPALELTRREREVLRLIGEGRTTRELAGMLGIAVKTAETHRGRLMHKLGAHGTSDLVHYAIRSLIAEV